MSEVRKVEDEDVQFVLGELFESYEELESKLEKFSKKHLVHFWRRDSRTVNGAHMKTHRHINERLKYYSVKYACIYGGQKFLPRGAGRRQSNTIRTNCPAHIMLRASKDGNKLEVTSVNNDHNHEISEELFKTLPQERKLIGEIKEEVQDLMQLHIDRKRLKEYIKFRTNKTLRTKDLFNIAAANKNKRVIPPDRAYDLIQRIHNFEKLRSENAAGKSGVSESEEEGSLAKRMKTEDDSPPWSQDNISNDLETGEGNGEEYAELTQDDIVDELTTADEDDKLMDDNRKMVDELVMDNGDSVIVESMVGSDGSVFVNEREFNYCSNPLSESVDDENSTEVLDMETIPTKNEVRKIRKNNSNSQTNDINDSNYVNESVPEKIWIMKENEIETEIDHHFHDSESNIQSVKHNSDNEHDINDMISDENGTNQKIILEQLAVLKAERNKLYQETEFYKLKREKLKLQINCFHNELKKQEMEKEKLRLEIKLLQSKVMDDNDVSHYIFVP